MSPEQDSFLMSETPEIISLQNLMGVQRIPHSKEQFWENLHHLILTQYPFIKLEIFYFQSK